MRFNLRHIVPIALLSLVGCGAETPNTEAPAAEAEEVGQARSMLRATGCPGCLAGTDGARFVDGVEREQVTGDIYHYTLKLQVGPDAHDVIALHRVVKEKAAGVPEKSAESVFLVHGDAWDFRGAFMASTLPGSGVDADHSIAVYLAGKGVDVWGIDLRWTQVPLGTQDFSFMAGWNLGTHAQDVGTGLRVARALRRATGSGYGKMNLLGWSRGAMVSYAWLNAETQLPPGQRSVSGFIPVDMVVKFGPEAEQQRQWACTRAAVAQQLRQAGQLEGNLSGPGAGVLIMQVGQAATYWPDAVAQPPLPPLPYRNLGFAVGAATFSFLTDANHGIYPTVPAYHFSAGVFSPEGVPTGLQYVQPEQFFSLLSAARPYQDFAEIVEGEQMQCGDKDLPYDDHLSEVKVPVLYVGAGGGFGRYGEYAVTNLLGSQDVSIVRVQRLTESQRVADYGHVDLFLASDAEQSVWAPIYRWMKKH
ncbi:hypothetical protein [Archangium sp.]|uniref:hypothetical protein n=1 Tax=Archangium sp. TaxID=1872627 RepID=UPI00389AC71F